MIAERSFKFALRSILLVKKLRADKEYIIADQFLRSATSIGANICEAEAGITKRDFISKIAIASKEARETRYWLHLLKESAILKENLDDLLDEIEQIIRILTKIVKTAQSNL